MEGVFFYWISWLLWVMATFFMKRESKHRFMLSFWLLVMMIVSPYKLSILNSQISLMGLLLFAIVFYLITALDKRQTMYMLLCSFITMLAYVCFQLYELFDPVWILFPRNGMLVAILVVLSLLLHQDKLMRLAIVILGSLQGELLFSLILKQYTFPYTIASLAYFDVCALTIGVLVLWNGFETLSTYYEYFFHQQTKGKEKLS